ncbi:hypothetical protein C2869_06130 [Saccharobesus litoralis]|uniref:Uncharacterized protein n=1 Tax=Saccharobesus litoralis TaxID=2172099 RepID=A0A2S0VP94_9ALTE|nr:hypothetical protein [Saccharobesus litoralis]AWB66041.1 hypothetical protein C2869_06130 [Saccharobesus litoralis]
MTIRTHQIPRIPARSRKDPLTDMSTLAAIGRAATKQARKKAFANGASVTFVDDGVMYRKYPDGKKEVIKELDTKAEFPRIEDDLCLD